MSTDTTFITNELDRTLLDRFRVLIKDTRFFDVLVGYFYTSGFHALYKSLEATEKIRILIGINTDKTVAELIHESHEPFQTQFQFSHAEAKEAFSHEVIHEMEHSEDSASVADGVTKFIEWLRSGKLEIKAYPSHNIHAKLYIMTFVEHDKDVGRVITGSSNFTQAGLVDNVEFNVELKDRADYEFALKKFNELWENSVDVKDEYLRTIQTKTWLNDNITPYELYIKFLYEYFKEQINRDLYERDDIRYLPDRFLDLEYQREAVYDARSKLEQYGGVFLSDVVGLGKTYIAALLARELDGRNLVIAPPALLSRESPGSWPNVFSDFHVPADCWSIGMIETLLEQNTDKYRNVFIDEAHRFRSESNVTFENIARICRGKRVILVTATPLNNTPRDILSQLKLFQKSKNSTIPNVRDLEKFFNDLERQRTELDRQQDYDDYIAIVKTQAREIREKILKHLMVRRTRSEIVKYFGADLEKQGLKFPEVADPEPVFYELDDHENVVFSKTIELVVNKFHYARYTPMLYFQGKVTQPEELAQKNMRKFMKVLLVKRLESSFHAFRKTLDRFIASYTQFLKEFDNGNIYVSKKYTGKLFEFLEDENEEAIQRLLDEDKAQRYIVSDFKPEFRVALESDLSVLQEIDRLWKTVKRDPKLLKFTDVLSSNPVLQNNKLVIFTESQETADYISGHLNKSYPGTVLAFSGGSGAAIREKVIGNFDANARSPVDEYRILVTTEVLSEGVNLHRSNVVINYDIPWNPARLMQRVGRINRVDTKFDKIYTFTFFPTTQSNDQIKLKEAAESKIRAFIEMLGTDARLLTDGEEIKSHDLFARLTSKKSITGEDEAENSELKYLQVIRDIRDHEPELFEKIKRLPKKARSGRVALPAAPSLLTYFRKGKLQKFYFSHDDITDELDFLSAATKLETDTICPRIPCSDDYFALLDKNKLAFRKDTEDYLPEIKKMKGGRDSATFILRILKSNEIKYCKEYTEDDEEYIKKVIRLIEEGALPRQTTKSLQRELSKDTNPLKILAKLKKTTPGEFFKETASEGAAQTAGPREVILSEYFTGN